MEVAEKEVFSTPPALAYAFSEEVPVEFPEEKLSSRDRNEVLEGVASLVPVLSFLGVDVSPVERAITLLKNPSEQGFAELPSLLEKTPDNFGIRKKLYEVATMSLMEFCHTYGCEEPTLRLMKEWKEKAEMHKIKRYERMLPLFSSTRELEKEIGKNEVMFPMRLYSSRLIYNVKKAKEALLEEKFEQFASYLAEIPYTNNLRFSSTSSILSEVYEDNPELAQKAVDFLEKKGYPYSLIVPPSSSLFSDVYEVSTDDGATARVMRGKKAIEIDISRGINIPIITFAESDMKFLVIICEEGSSVWLIDNGGERKRLIEGQYRLKGPLLIEVVDKKTRLLYKVKEPLLLNLVVKYKEKPRFGK